MLLPRIKDFVVAMFAVLRAGARLEVELLENEFGDNGFDSEMEYAEGLFDRERIEAFHDLYIQMLEALIRREDVLEK